MTLTARSKNIINQQETYISNTLINIDEKIP